MKRLLIALAMIAALAVPQETTAQKHRAAAQAQSQQVQATDTMGIEAVSDTTDLAANDTSAADSAANDTAAVSAVLSHNGGAGGFFPFAHIVDNGDLVPTSSLVFVGTVVFFMFVLAPVLILALIGFFIYKWRKQNLKLAEMAMQNGQQIPTDVKRRQLKTPDDYWRSGIRKISIGLGLAVVGVLCFDSWEIAGIGFFVAIYGAGNLVIAKKSAPKREETETDVELTDKDF